MLIPNKDYYLWDVVIAEGVRKDDTLWGQKTGIVQHIWDRVIRLQDIKWKNFKVYLEQISTFVRKWQRIEDVIQIDKIEKELWIKQ